MNQDDLLTKIMVTNRIKSSGIALKDQLHLAGALIGGTAGGLNTYKNPYSTATDVVKNTTVGALVGTGAVMGGKAVVKYAPGATKDVGQLAKDLRAGRALRLGKKP